MEETEKKTVRAYIFTVGIAVFLGVFCYGCRQIAMLEERISRQTRYEVLEQELADLTDETIEDFF